ncbi:MAG: hypothetical protein NTV51_03160 [Verrucomicrobia bacterium]|nr:hypothetical protein [Verrucomicrobiota bacterium]
MNPALLLLADVPAPASAPDASYVATGLVVVGLSALVQLALAAKQLLAPARAEDPAAPASLTAIAGELRLQTATLHKLDREMGGVVTTIASFQRELAELKATHTKDTDAAHQKLAGLARDLAGTIVRVDGLEKREGAP